MMASSAGGVEIEEVARLTPEKIIKAHIDPLLGLRDYQARDIAAGIDLPANIGEFLVKLPVVCGRLTPIATRPWPRSTRW